jgi:hypothetical protein
VIEGSSARKKGRLLENRGCVWEDASKNDTMRHPSGSPEMSDEGLFILVGKGAVVAAHPRGD